MPQQGGRESGDAGYAQLPTHGHPELQASEAGSSARVEECMAAGSALCTTLASWVETRAASRRGTAGLPSPSHVCLMPAGSSLAPSYPCLQPPCRKNAGASAAACLLHPQVGLLLQLALHILQLGEALVRHALQLRRPAGRKAGRDRGGGHQARGGVGRYGAKRLGRGGKRMTRTRRRARGPQAHRPKGSPASPVLRNRQVALAVEKVLLQLARCLGVLQGQRGAAWRRWHRPSGRSSR